MTNPTKAPHKAAPTHPAAARLQSDKLSVADMTKAIVEKAAKPDPTPGLPTPSSAGDERELTPRSISFRVDYESPDTGALETFELVSQVPDGAEVATMARTAAAFAQVPLDMLAAIDREYFVALGRAFVQLRDIPDRVRELLLDPEFLFPVYERLVEHERRFRLRGRKPSNGSAPEPGVRLSPWGAS